MAIPWTHWFENLADPVGFLWGCCVLAVIWLGWRGQWKRAAWPAVLGLLIWVVGATPIAADCLATLERPYAGVNLRGLPKADVVVMLGGVGAYSPQDLFHLDLRDGASRVVTAVQLLKDGKAGALALGGGGLPGHPETYGEGAQVAVWLKAWHLVQVPIYPMGINWNTHDECLHFSKLAARKGWRHILLVTSAYHMRRAAALFRHKGFQVEPVPCDFEGLAELESPSRFKWVPEMKGFHLWQVYLHEEMGWWYYRLRGWI